MRNGGEVKEKGVREGECARDRVNVLGKDFLPRLVSRRGQDTVISERKRYTLRVYTESQARETERERARLLRPGKFLWAI